MVGGGWRTVEVLMGGDGGCDGHDCGGQQASVRMREE
jgi:hypothetical protein